LQNQIIILQGINILTPVLAEYVIKNLKFKYADLWWKSGIINKLKPHQKRELPFDGGEEFLKAKLDIDKLTLIIADIHWNNIFSVNPSIFRTYIRELRDIRNSFIAHLGSNSIEDRDVYRAFDTMGRILQMIGKESKFKELNALIDEIKPQESIKMNSHTNGIFENKLDEREESSITLILDAYCRRVVMRLRNDGYTGLVNEHDILKWTDQNIGIAKTDFRTAKKEASLEWIVELKEFREYLEIFNNHKALTGSYIIEKTINNMRKDTNPNFQNIINGLEQNFINVYGIREFIMSQIMRYWKISYNTYSGVKVNSGYIIIDKKSCYKILYNKFSNLI
jgi:hypothetical protein